MPIFVPICWTQMLKSVVRACSPTKYLWIFESVIVLNATRQSERHWIRFVVVPATHSFTCTCSSGEVWQITFLKTGTIRTHIWRGFVDNRSPAIEWSTLFSNWLCSPHHHITRGQSNIRMKELSVPDNIIWWIWFYRIIFNVIDLRTHELRMEANRKNKQDNENDDCFSVIWMWWRSKTLFIRADFYNSGQRFYLLASSLIEVDMDAGKFIRTHAY